MSLLVFELNSRAKRDTENNIVEDMINAIWQTVNESKTIDMPDTSKIDNKRIEIFINNDIIGQIKFNASLFGYFNIIV